MITKHFLISLVVFTTSIILVALISLRGTPRVVKINLENIPMKIGAYSGVKDSFGPAVYDALNADENIYRHYRDAAGNQVDLYIGYYGTAKGGRTGHNPYACLPGSGWGIIKSGQKKIKSSYYPDGVNVNYILSRKGDIYEVMLDWYQSEGTKVLPNGISQNIYRFISRILYNRNDGAFIRLTAVTDAKHIKETEKRVQNFSQKILELIPNYWPIER